MTTLCVLNQGNLHSVDKSEKNYFPSVNKLMNFIQLHLNQHCRHSLWKSVCRSDDD